MTKKGFTLIELLAIIVILAIIALITTPLVLNTIDNAKKGAFKASVYGIIESASNNYFLDIIQNNEKKGVIYNYIDGKETSNISGKSLNYKGSKPENGNLIINTDGKISVALYKWGYCAMKDNNEEEIKIDKKDKNDCSIKITLPRIELKDETTINIEINDPYIDFGFIAYDEENNEITDQVNVIITKNNKKVENVDTSILGTYIVTYSLTNNNKYVEEIRTINIIDTTPPVLNIPDDISIFEEKVETFDLMTGVTVTDNSNETIEITISGNLSSIPGEYEITYKAMDSSGNKKEKTRKITVVESGPPTEWQFYEAIIETKEWVIPKTGWYKIHVIGTGGRGGNGANGSYMDSSFDGVRYYRRSGGSGAGGSGGGLAISIIHLEKNTIISATVTSSLSSFGEYGTALKGDNGGSGSTPPTTNSSGGAKGVAGLGGAASNGNYLNLTGNKGSDGINGAYTTGSGYAVRRVGGNGSLPLSESQYYSSPQAIGTMNTPGYADATTTDGVYPLFGGGGTGGTSGNIGTERSLGGAGAPGGIVIEIAK